MRLRSGCQRAAWCTERRRQLTGREKVCTRSKGTHLGGRHWMEHAITAGHESTRIARRSRHAWAAPRRKASRLQRSTGPRVAPQADRSRPVGERPCGAAGSACSIVMCVRAQMRVPSRVQWRGRPRETRAWTAHEKARGLCEAVRL